MHLYLDPVGGVAGDMFAGALLDAWPELEAELQAALAAAGLDELVAVERLDHRDHSLSGSRFQVTPRRPAGHHRSYREIRGLLSNTGLPAGAERRALDIFAVLAEAEARVHGGALDAVSFHEVGAWDSIADVVSAAWLIDRLGVKRWWCAPLPMGSGQVDSAHGRLPLPAPATALLLEGFPLYQDGLQGERVTPTGAAILRHLEPSFAPLGPAALRRSGVGFGTKTFSGISNVLRVLVFDPPVSSQTAFAGDEVLVCQFEVDDQSGEDLALGLQRLRALPAVLDVTQSAAFGKKGRLTTCVQVLALADALEPVLTACFSETSTLGVRWQRQRRAVLARDTVTADGVRVKRARRPGAVTAKAELDDLAASGDRRQRESLRRRAEATALQEPADDDR